MGADHFTTTTISLLCWTLLFESSIVMLFHYCRLYHEKKKYK